MKVGNFSSIIGDFTGEIRLIVGVGVIAEIALKLGPLELFTAYFSAFVVVGKSVFKGLASAALGVSIKMVGTDLISASEGYTFGSYELLNSIGLVR